MRSLREPKALTIQPMRCRSDQNIAQILSKRPQQNGFQVVHFTSARRFDDGQLAKSCTAFSGAIAATFVCTNAADCSGGKERVFAPGSAGLCAPPFAAKKSTTRKRIRRNVIISDIDSPIGHQALICACSWIHNELALHASVVNSAGHRTSELVRPRS